LNRETLRRGKEAQTIVENWRQEYNNYRLHSSLGYLAPSEFARGYYEKDQTTEGNQLSKPEASWCKWC
jgi:putative transposase